MTPAPMIACAVIAVAILVGLIIATCFAILDYFKLKNCNHFCIFCKYRKECDWHK